MQTVLNVVVSYNNDSTWPYIRESEASDSLLWNQNPRGLKARSMILLGIRNSRTCWNTYQSVYLFNKCVYVWCQSSKTNCLHEIRDHFLNHRSCLFFSTVYAWCFFPPSSSGFNGRLSERHPYLWHEAHPGGATNVQTKGGVAGEG